MNALGIHGYHLISLEALIVIQTSPNHSKLLNLQLFIYKGNN